MTRAYRTQLELLTDFLEAVRRYPRKTRIIGYSNINPSSFEAYVQLCIVNRLVERTVDGYRTTPLADQVIEATRRVLNKSTELDDAVRTLHHLLPSNHPSRPISPEIPELPSPRDWDSIIFRSIPRLTSARSGAFRVRRESDLLSTSASPIILGTTAASPPPSAPPPARPRREKPRLTRADVAAAADAGR
jgi:predicted transcriptional regulator